MVSGVRIGQVAANWLIGSFPNRRFENRTFLFVAESSAIAQFSLQQKVFQ
jgi:hypothetical protein